MKEIKQKEERKNRTHDKQDETFSQLLIGDVIQNVKAITLATVIRVQLQVGVGVFILLGESN